MSAKLTTIAILLSLLAACDTGELASHRVRVPASPTAQTYWKEGMSLEQGALAAAQRRLRPVLMTTSVAMLGLFPAALSRGIGSETQRPLAIVVIGGALMLAVLPRLLQPALLVLVHGRDRRDQLTAPAAAEPTPQPA